MAQGHDPRCHNRRFRRKMQARMRAEEAPCHICRGRLGPIRYDQPSDPQHPLSFVIDEVRPVSRWREFGYESAIAAAQDPVNLAPAHWCCNAAKSNKLPGEAKRGIVAQVFLPDGDW